MNEYFEFLSSEPGMKFLGFIGAGVAVSAFGVFRLMKFLKKDVSAKDHSIASGRDTIITNHSDENSHSKE